MKRPFVAIAFAALSTLSTLSFGALPSSAMEYKEMEKMTDRCSGDVIVVPNYSALLTADGSIYLKRDKSGNTELSDYLRVGAQQIRWYCNSKSPYGWVDPGTWRVRFVVDAIPGPVKGLPFIVPAATAKDGWFPERSRCPSGTSHLRARLGTDRLLRIICYKQA